MNEYVLTPWSNLTEEDQKYIIANQATQPGHGYIDPKDYEKSNFYTLNGRLAKGTDVDNWLKQQNTSAQVNKSLVQSFIDRMGWGQDNPIWGNRRISNFQKTYDKNPNFMDNWQVAENAIEGSNIMTGGILNRLSPTQNIRLAYDLVTGKPIFTGQNGQLGSWWSNNGIATDNFAQNHPYLNMGLQGFLDGSSITLFKNINNLNKLRRMEKWYSGVPHEEIRSMPGVYMDENFPNYTGERWFSNNPDYGKAFIWNNGTVFSTYIDPKELNIMQTPRFKNPQPYFKINAKFNSDIGKYIPFDVASEETNLLRKAKELNIPRSERTNYIKENMPTPTTTDKIVATSKELGYDATKMYNIDDGYVGPINEIVLNEGSPMYVGNTKFDIVKQLNWKIPNIGVILYNSYNKNK